MIEHNKAGIRKTPGTNLVNNITGEIIYTPPQDENEIIHASKMKSKVFKESYFK